MSSSLNTLELDSARSLRIQSWEWVIERAGWLLICLAVFAGIVGAFGRGTVSMRTVTSPEGHITVEYDVLQRYDCPAKLRVWFRQPRDEAGLAQILLSRAFTERIEVESVSPPPVETEMRDDVLVYSFRVAQLNGSGAITYRYRHDSVGRLRYEIGYNGQSVRLTQFVYP
jgi:hypothetical protein